MTDWSELIEEQGYESGAKNRWVPSGAAPNAVAVRWEGGELFVQIYKDGKSIHVQLSQDEMIAFGMACIQTAKGL